MAGSNPEATKSSTPPPESRHIVSSQNGEAKFLSSILASKSKRLYSLVVCFAWASKAIAKCIVLFCTDQF